MLSNGLLRQCHRCYCVLITLLWIVGGSTASHNDDEQWKIPEETLRPFGSYPNILNISPEDAKHFHPIVVFPRACWKNYRFVCPYSDYSVLQSYTSSQLLPRNRFEKGRHRIPLLARFRRFWRSRILFHDKSKRYIGRYDEDRVNLYDTELFTTENSTTNNTTTKRTVHVGIDLAGYVGTPVYSFDTGIIQSLGYNPAHGDYGNVVIVKYSESFFVLYGHLDAASCQRHKVGDIIHKGDTVGWMGDAYEVSSQADALGLPMPLTRENPHFIEWRMDESACACSNQYVASNHP